MRIEIKNYDKNFIVETENDDLDIFEYFEIFNNLLIQVGFMPETVKNAIKDLADEQETNN